MKLGRVSGHVVSTNKLESLTGLKFLKVELIDDPNDASMIVVDRVGAGVNDVVLITEGSSCQWAFDHDEGKPIDACIVGVVDDYQ